MKEPTGSRGGGPRFTGARTVLDGRAAVSAVDAAIARRAGLEPAAPLADGWASAVTAGMSMTGVRASLTSRRHLAALHESLYADAGKRLTYVLNVASRSATRQAPTAYAGHDDYHAVDDTGLFQMFAHDVQSAADLSLIAHRIAELSLTPGLVAHDSGPAIQTLRLPDPALVQAYLGDPSDLIEAPTPAQRLAFGEKRRRIPELFDVDYPAMLGAAQTPASYAQGVAAQRPFYLEHIAGLADRAFAEYADLTGRTYARITGHWLDDAEYLLVAQGSIVPVAEAVCDHLRATNWIRVGVLNLAMFRPFPADLLSSMLVGRKGVTVLERVDQPLSADPPLLREIRATMSKAAENGRAKGQLPFPALASCRATEAPAFYAGCYGLGGREAQAADLVAAVSNMVARGPSARQFYLGVDFVRPETRFPKQQVWQDQLVDDYPHVAGLTLPRGSTPHLLTAAAAATRIHGLQSDHAVIEASRALVAVADVLELHLQACPRLAQAPAGRDVTIDASFGDAPVRLAAELERVTAAVAAGPRALAAPDALGDMVDDGVLVVERFGTLENTWRLLPAAARRTIVDKRLKVFALDLSELGAAMTGAPDRERVRVLALIGALARVSGLVDRAEISESTFLDGLKAGLARAAGERMLEESLQAVRRGFKTLVALTPDEYAGVLDEPVGELPVMPALLAGTNVTPGIGHGGRFWEQVGVMSALGIEGLADPYAALGAIPAATSAIRDMTATREEVPVFIADRCTGCGDCWVQCPEAAIPGVVSDVADIITAALTVVEADRRCDRLRQIVKPLAGEIRRAVKTGPFASFGVVVSAAYATVADKLGLDAERRAALDAEFHAVHGALSDFPVARTERYFDAHEKTTKGAGGLLSVTVNPTACKGCGICIDACPEEALRPVAQTGDVIATLRRNWTVWQHLPETPDRYVEAGDDAVASLLLKQRTYQSMIGGGDVAPEAGQKTALHLVLSAVSAFVMPRTKRRVERLTELIEGLDHKARTLLAADARVDSAEALDATPDGKVLVPIDQARRAHLDRIAKMIGDLTDLRWRYTEGPGGRGRASCGMANDGSAAWGSTYPYNPYPFPWASHLLHDAPSVAMGLFEGQMRKMARGFACVRRAELELAGDYDAAEHEPALASLDWRQFTDDELALSPPVLAVGGIETMLDLGFQNLSRLLASNRPVRVVVFASPAAGVDAADERRRDLALLAMAHRHAFVAQASPASPAHLLTSVTRGLGARGPAVFVLHAPADRAPDGRASTLSHAAKLALESRAFPVLTYDPSAGPTDIERLSLDGNPMPDQPWPTYELAYADERGDERRMTLPLTVADWAAGEPSLHHHFTELAPSAPADGLVRFDEYLALSPLEREGKVPFIYVLGTERRLDRRAVSAAIVELAGSRLDVWRHLRQVTGHDLPEGVRARLTAPVETEFKRKITDLEAEHRARVADLESRYPALVARRLVEGLVRAAGDGTATIAELLRRAAAAPGITAIGTPAEGNGSSTEAPTAPPAVVMPAAPPPAETIDAPPPAPAPAEAEEADEPLAMDPYIQSELCTSCDECININKRMFGYNKQKQAYIKDPKAGTFRQLVLAAQKCPVSIIHPGTPVNPDEPDLDKWVEQAARFQ